MRRCILIEKESDRFLYFQAVKYFHMDCSFFKTKKTKQKMEAIAEDIFWVFERKYEKHVADWDIQSFRVNRTGGTLQVMFLESK